jgi:hypothetical protein
MSEEQYLKICKGEFQKINDKLDNLYHKLFEDNDIESIQSRVNRHEDFINDYKNNEMSKKTNWSVYMPVWVSVFLVLGDFVFRYITGK